MLRPDDQTAILDDVLIAGQTRRQHAEERIDHHEQNDREDTKLDKLFERCFLFQPGRSASCELSSVNHDANNPSWPALRASLLAPMTSSVPRIPLIKPAAAVMPHWPPTMPLK